MSNDPLDQPAHAGLIHGLHERGVLSAPARAAGMEWLRRRVEWRRSFSILLLVLGVLLVLAGILCFVVGNWENLGRFAKLGGVELLLVAAAVGAWRVGLDKIGGKVLLLASCVLVGAMLLLIGTIYPTGAPAWQLFALWTVLIFGWVLASKCSGVWVLWMLLLNITVALVMEAKLWQFLPLFGDADKVALVCISLAAIDALALACRERAVMRGVAWLSGRESRHVLLVPILLALFFPTEWLVFDFRGTGSLSLAAAGLNAAALAGCLLIYRSTLPDIAALALAALSICATVVSLIGRILFEELHGVDDALKFLAFALLILLVFGAAIFWLKRTHKAMAEVLHD
ncbi:MAG TPA: DUF2157 domain-containing protein [Planctomycetota bacterium]|jgi:uncharacterized membrane protein